MTGIGAGVPLALTVRRPVPACRVRLLVLPYAGGGSGMSNGWQATLPPDVEIVDVDLPARGGRIREPPIATIDEYVDRLALAHVRRLADRPLVVYGHSLGAVVGFELACRLVADDRAPIALVASGHPAPHLPARREHVHHLPRDRFIDALRELRGTPDELLDNPEAMDLLLPAIRSDFAISERYRFRPRPPLPIPIAVLVGRSDAEVPLDQAAAWSCHTTEGCSVEMLPGGHFFPVTHPGPFLDRLGTLLGRF